MQRAGCAGKEKQCYCPLVCGRLESYTSFPTVKKELAPEFDIANIEKP